MPYSPREIQIKLTFSRHTSTKVMTRIKRIWMIEFGLLYQVAYLKYTVIISPSLMYNFRIITATYSNTILHNKRSITNVGIQIVVKNSFKKKILNLYQRIIWHTFYCYTLAIPQFFKPSEWFLLTDGDNIISEVEFFCIKAKESEPEFSDTFFVLTKTLPITSLRREKNSEFSG